MRDFELVVGNLTVALIQNGDMTIHLQEEINNLHRRDLWTPSEGTAPWNELRNLLMGVFPENHPRARQYCDIL